MNPSANPIHSLVLAASNGGFAASKAAGLGSVAKLFLSYATSLVVMRKDLPWDLGE